MPPAHDILRYKSSHVLLRAVRCCTVNARRLCIVGFTEESPPSSQRAAALPACLPACPLSSSEASSPVGRAVPSLSRLCNCVATAQSTPCCLAAALVVRRWVHLACLAVACAFLRLHWPQLLALLKGPHRHRQNPTTDPTHPRSPLTLLPLTTHITTASRSHSTISLFLEHRHPQLHLHITFMCSS